MARRRRRGGVSPLPIRHPGRFSELGSVILPGPGSPCLFLDAAAQVKLLVHGDDFVGIGRSKALDEFQRNLEARYECKTQRLGWRKEVASEARVLGRIITLDDSGATIEADPALLEEAVHQLGLTDASSVNTPGARTEYFGQGSGNEVKQRRLMGEHGDDYAFRRARLAELVSRTPGTTMALPRN